jgi:histidinol dehydrogenase
VEIALIKITELNRRNLEQNLTRASAEVEAEVVAAVGEIIAAVRARGDAALIDYTERFDGVRLPADGLRVTAAERDAALGEVPAGIIESLRLAAERIERFHRRQLPDSWEIAADGMKIGQRAGPIARAGLYVPGGLADYPSSVLMNAIPAQVAGVEEIALCVPPGRDGRVSKFVLAAAALIGVDEIYRVGGAQAVAAMAYGTETIKPVDKITGPGNVYVATAKRLVVGKVGIDMIAGPTEIVIIADARARPDFIAADMIAQAEHDRQAQAILLTDDRALAVATAQWLERLMKEAGRREIAQASLTEFGRLYLVDDLDTAIEFINRFAPEHLEIMTAEPESYLPRIKHAGAVFLGDYTPEALGDYVAGSNHVLPTASTARFYSPLGVYDFIKWSTVLSFDRRAMGEIGKHAAALAGVEGFDGHRRSVELRLEDSSKS